MPALIFIKQCESTNVEILKFLDPLKPDLTALYTLNQTKGKGQYGNSWECAENLNLAFTLALPATRWETQDHLFNFRTASLLADFLANMTKNRVEVKWPNDIIMKHKKVSGILTEKKTTCGVTYFLIGIGLNLLQEDFAHLPKAGSVLTQTGLELNPVCVAEALFSYLKEHVQDEFSVEELFENINRRLFRKEMISVFEVGGIRQNGRIKEIDTDGFLWVELEQDGLKKFYNKEIELLY